MPQVEVAPRIQGMTSQVVDQRSLDFDGILNFDMSGGTAVPRRGWEILNAPDSYNEVADPMSPDGFSYEPSHYTYASERYKNPLGSFLWSGPDGQDLVLSLHLNFQSPLFIQELLVGFAVYDTQGRQLLQRASLLQNAGTYAEPSDATYCFVRIYDDVFFCNGGYLWRWNPLRSLYPDRVQCFHNPQQIGVDTYVLGYLRGATIATAHQQSLVLSGFAQDTTITVDAPIDTNGDGIVTVLDYSKIGGFRLGPSATELIITPYTMLVSDPLLPNCFSIQGIYNIGTSQPVSGIASHYGRMVVLSQCECYVVEGPAAQATQSTIQPLSNLIGCASHRSIVQTEDGLLLWLSDDGVYAWNGGGLPELISGQIQDLFDKGWGAVCQKSPYASAAGNQGSGTDSGLTNDTSRFFKFERATASLATAVWLSRDGYYALALSASAAVEYNNVILCWSPTRKLWWIYGGAPASFGWDLQTDGTNIWYEATGAVTIRSATTGFASLMTSQNQPGVLFCQGFHNPSPGQSVTFPFITQPNHYCLAAMVGDTDTKQEYDGFGDLTISRQQFFAFMQSAPFWLERDDFGMGLYLNLKMRATRNVMAPCVSDGSSAKQATVGMMVMSENAHFDVLYMADTSAEMQYIVANGDVADQNGMMQPFPDSYIRQDVTYFWQDIETDDPTIGAWYDSILGAATSTAFKRWLPDTYFNKRINLSARVSQWYRVCIFTRCDGCVDDGVQPLGNGSNSLDILGWSIDRVPLTDNRK